MIWILHRLLSLLVAGWLAATLSFFALRILPGDAIRAQLEQSGVSLSVIEQRRYEQGLDDPIGIQYLRYLMELAQGNLGYSLLSGQPVSEMIGAQFAPTLTLAIAAVLLATLGGLLAGVVTATSTPLILSTVLNLLINLALSMPIYWTGTLAILVFSTGFHLLPSTGAGRLSQLVLPAGVLGFHSAGAIALIIRGNLKEVMAADFVRTARAKGLPNHLILRRHVLRVGLLPVITVISLQLGFLLSGTIITESLFVRPGLGRLLLERTLRQDYPVVQGIVVLTAIVYSLLNALTDVIYRLVDPRIVAA